MTIQQKIKLLKWELKKVKKDIDKITPKMMKLQAKKQRILGKLILLSTGESYD